jgi:Peptidase family M28
MSSADGLRQRRPAAGTTPPVAPTRAPKAVAAAAAASHAPLPERSSSSGVALLSTFLLLGIAVGAVRLRTENLTPDGSDAAPGTPSALFDAGVAMRHVQTIAAKPRWVGSNELDRSLEYVQREIEGMAAAAEENGMLLEVEAFTASGSFGSSIGPTNVLISYGNILSVVAKLGPAGAPPGGALLVNAHVDSAWGAPGASDNVVGVAVALEAMRSISRTPPNVDRLARPVVFLFNGAEEPLLAGADGFLKTHRWAADGIAAHVNLESVGSGDSYLLFQLGPGSSWLAKAYARAVKRPSASVAGSEVFERNVVPGETDFRVFKEAGIPGYDLALVRNGHVYHTRYDDVKHVSMNVLKYGGQVLVVPLVMELAGRNDAVGKHLLLSREAAPEGDLSRAAWFDVLGLFMVVYSESTSAVVGWSLVALALALFLSHKPVSASGASPGRGGGARSLLHCRLRMLLCLAAGCFAGFASATTAAMVYVHALERPMSWYGSVRFALATFVPPFFVGATTMLPHVLPADLSSTVAHNSAMHAVSASYAVLLAGLTYSGVMTAFLPIALLSSCVLASAVPLPAHWVFARLLIVAVPVFALGAPTSYDSLCVLLSIFGRSGSAPSDVLASVLVSFYTAVYGLLPLLPMYAFYPASLPRIRRYALVISCLVACLVALLPELTLPHRDAVYSKDAPKRIVVAHFHAPQQTPSNVLGIVPLDVISVDLNTTVRMLPFTDKDVLDHTPVWGSLGSTIGEGTRPFDAFLGNWSIFAIDDPLDLAVPTASVVATEAVPEGAGQGLVNVSLLVSAPDSLHLSLRIPRAAGGGVARAWSFDAEMVDLGDGGGCWVRHVGRGAGAEELRFSVVVQVDGATGERPPIVFDVTSSRPGMSRSSTLKALYFPQWAAPVYVQTTGASFSL